MQILASASNVEIVAAVRNDGIISLVEGNGKKTNEYLFSYYADAMRKFEKSYDNKKIYVSIAKEMHAVELAAEEFGNGVKIIGKD